MSAGGYRIEGLDLDLMDFWWTERQVADRPAAKFAFSYFLFNHVYEAYWKGRTGRPRRERDRVVGMAATKAVADAIHAMQRDSILGKLKIDLPLEGLNGDPVPAGRDPGTYTCGQLSPEEYLNVMYQVRCNYFHGDAGGRGLPDDRIMAYTKTFNEFIKLLLGRLDLRAASKR